jgi:hypothetical protein
MDIVIDDHLLRARVQGTVPAVVYELRGDEGQIYTTESFRRRLQDRLEHPRVERGVHNRYFDEAGRRAALVRLPAAAIVIPDTALGVEIETVRQAAPDYANRLLVPALAAALHVDGLLVLHRRNFGGKVPGRLGPIADAVGVTIRIVDDA